MEWGGGGGLSYNNDGSDNRKFVMCWCGPNSFSSGLTNGSITLNAVVTAMVV